jgi:hypothetical protein
MRVALCLVRLTFRTNAARVRAQTSLVVARQAVGIEAVYANRRRPVKGARNKPVANRPTAFEAFVTQTSAATAALAA